MHMQDPPSQPTLDRIMVIIIVLGVLIGQQKVGAIQAQGLRQIRQVRVRCALGQINPYPDGFSDGFDRKLAMTRFMRIEIRREICQRGGQILPEDCRRVARHSLAAPRERRLV